MTTPWIKFRDMVDSQMMEHNIDSRKAVLYLEGFSVDENGDSKQSRTISRKLDNISQSSNWTTLILWDGTEVEGQLVATQTADYYIMNGLGYHIGEVMEVNTNES